jgi:hypothetical protein
LEGEDKTLEGEEKVMMETNIVRLVIRLASETRVRVVERKAKEKLIRSIAEQV